LGVLELSFKFCNFGDGTGVGIFYAALVHFYARTKRSVDKNCVTAAQYMLDKDDYKAAQEG
jgi:hypothetical protein